jgi:ParB family chromosome partitioning protein
MDEDAVYGSTPSASQGAAPQKQPDTVTQETQPAQQPQAQSPSQTQPQSQSPLPSSQIPPTQSHSETKDAASVQPTPAHDTEVPLSSIVVNPKQPRKKFDDGKLKELSQSIQEHGIVQPLVVTKQGEDFELVAGERRMRAAKMAGLEKAPVVVKDVDDQGKLEMAIIENVQRHDLDPIDEARAYQRLADEFQMSQESIAKKMGKSRSVIANKIRLLQLPIEIQKGIEEEKITEGHAKAILSLDNAEKQRALYDLILQQHLTVRQTESRAQQALGVKPKRRTANEDPELKAVEDEMHEYLGTKVRVAKQGDGAKVVIDCYTKEELKQLVDRIKNNEVTKDSTSSSDVEL